MPDCVWRELPGALLAAGPRRASHLVHQSLPEPTQTHPPKAGKSNPWAAACGTSLSRHRSRLPSLARFLPARSRPWPSRAKEKASSAWSWPSGIPWSGDPRNDGGVNGWTQQLLEVYSRESESPRFFSGVDLSAVPLCPDPTGYSRTGLFSSGSIVVIAHSCFRSSHAAKDSADHRSRLSHPWPL